MIEPIESNKGFLMRIWSWVSIRSDPTLGPSILALVAAETRRCGYSPTPLVLARTFDGETEGEVCGRWFCEGVLQFTTDGPCSCNSPGARPPCGACTSSYIICPECEWDGP